MTDWKNRAFRERFDDISEHMQMYPQLYDEDGKIIDFEESEQLLINTQVIKIPELKSKWRHNNGIKYKVISIANELNTEKYPITVIYKGKNGKVWSRPLSDWHRSFSKA